MVGGELADTCGSYRGLDFRNAREAVPQSLDEKSQMMQRRELVSWRERLLPGGGLTPGLLAHGNQRRVIGHGRDKSAFQHLY